MIVLTYLVLLRKAAKELLVRLSTVRSLSKSEARPSVVGSCAARRLIIRSKFYYRH